MLSSVDKNILNQIDNNDDIFLDVHNIRSNGKSVSRSTSKNVKIKNKADNTGLDVVVSPGTKGQKIHVPVILSKENFSDTVNNTFHIGEYSDVSIMSGCGVNNAGNATAKHDGMHEIFIHKGARLKYVEKHFAAGTNKSRKIFSTKTVIEVEEDGILEMELVQIKGVDESEKDMLIKLHKNAKLTITERMFTELDQKAKSKINIEMIGDNSTAQVVSRSVGKDDSIQNFYFMVKGDSKCKGHIECDSIIMGNARVTSTPALAACNEDAELIHEAAIGKIASEQLLKLMSLGLTEKEAEETILKGFLK